MKYGVAAISSLVGILAVTWGTRGAPSDPLVAIGITLIVLSGVAVLMLRLERSSVLLAVGTAVVLAYGVASVQQVPATVPEWPFPLGRPDVVHDRTLGFTCWGVGMAFALGLASRRHHQWIAAALASVATVPVLGLLVRTMGSRNTWLAGTYLYRVAVIAGLGLWAGILLFHLGTSVARATDGRPRSSRPIVLVAALVCGLQVLVFARAATLHLPPLRTAGGVLVGLITVGPVCYVSSRAGLAWARNRGSVI